MILNTFSIRFVVLLALDRLARGSNFLLISASYLLFIWHYFKSEGRGPDLRKWRGADGCVTPLCSVAHLGLSAILDTVRKADKSLLYSPIMPARQRDICSVSVNLPSAFKIISVPDLVPWHYHWSPVNYSPPPVDPEVILLFGPV